MKKLIGLVTGDIHYHDWKQFNNENRRIHISDAYLSYIFEFSHDNCVPIFHTGDIFHTPDNLSNKTLYHFFSNFTKIIQKYPKSYLIGISGNHDIDESYSYLKTLSLIFPNNVKCIDNSFVSIDQRTIVWGIPYLLHNIGFKEKIEEISEEIKLHHKDKDNILLIHTNLYGARDPNGYEITEVPNIPRNMGKFFGAFDLILSGHIHKSDELWENIVMVGAPYQQRKSDSGTDMGYRLVYSNHTTQFVKFNTSEFKFYNDGEEVDDYNFWCKIPKPIIIPKAVKHGIHVDTSRKELAIRYMRLKKIKGSKRLKSLIDVLTKAEE